MGGEHRSSGGSPRSVEIQRGERVWDASTPTTMDAVEELTQLSESMRQVASLLADDDPCDDSAPRRLSTFVNAVALGNVVSIGHRHRDLPARSLVCSPDLIQF
ncbi:Os10g0185200 [Oryza sativa Japonica Group]|uniref:Os10g0185200 protein n=1 Tax=Oryza sativa subsp. japonica TaxID=39947 RepID=A0A0N7KRJ0_ORYSJ|nr:Os10g0185200 [Oryza sativa Japonica Group]